MMRRSLLAMLAVALQLAAARAHAQGQPENPGNAAPGSVGPGDYIAMKIWLEPDLSDTVQVDPAGLGVFPKLGPIQVTGIQPDSLERLLVQSYSRYLQNPSIRVTVLRRITVWGSVVRPGAYPVDLTMSITDALALAGGATADGKADKVELRRAGDRKEVDLSDTASVGSASLRSGDQLFVPQRSWGSRNVGLILGAIGTAISVAYLVGR